MSSLNDDEVKRKAVNFTKEVTLPKKTENNQQQLKQDLMDRNLQCASQVCSHENSLSFLTC